MMLFPALSISCYIHGGRILYDPLTLLLRTSLYFLSSSVLVKYSLVTCDVVATEQSVKCVGQSRRLDTVIYKYLQLPIL